MSGPPGPPLVSRVLEGEARRAALRGAAELPSLTLDHRTVADLELIATGAYSPLTGFLGSGDYRRVIHEMRLADGRPWPLPVTLRGTATAGLEETVALKGPDGTVLGLLYAARVRGARLAHGGRLPDPESGAPGA